MLCILLCVMIPQFDNRCRSRDLDVRCGESAHIFTHAEALGGGGVKRKYTVAISAEDFRGNKGWGINNLAGAGDNLPIRW